MNKQEKKEMLNCIRGCVNEVIFNKFLSFMNFNKNEKIILEMIRKQYSYQEIADEINYSYRQVQRIIDEILNKISKIITTLDKQTDSTKEIFKIIFLENMS
ncbi:MAG: hypothetical protein HFE57_03550 [Firmicutes bacterium]|nr:hypothetical protein [Bacillota bacterium]